MRITHSLATASLSIAFAGAALAGAPAMASPLSSSDALGSSDLFCASDLGPAEEAAKRIDPPMEGRNWVLDKDQNYDRCKDLSFVTVTTEGGTGSSPDQLLLFHKGEFLGTGIDHNMPFQKIVDSGNDFVTVSYGTPGTANADVQWQDPVTFRWVGDHVQAEGDLPVYPIPA